MMMKNKLIVLLITTLVWIGSFGLVWDDNKDWCEEENNWLRGYNPSNYDMVCTGGSRNILYWIVRFIFAPFQAFFILLKILIGNIGQLMNSLVF